MQLFFINNDGGGFADTIEVADGTSIAQGTMLSDELVAQMRADLIRAKQLLRAGA